MTSSCVNNGYLSGLAASSLRILDEPAFIRPEELLPCLRQHLPDFETKNDRFSKQICDIINRLLGKGQGNGEQCFLYKIDRFGNVIPFPNPREISSVFVPHVWLDIDALGEQVRMEVVADGRCVGRGTFKSWGRSDTFVIQFKPSVTVQYEATVAGFIQESENMVLNGIDLQHQAVNASESIKSRVMPIRVLKDVNGTWIGLEAPYLPTTLWDVFQKRVWCPGATSQTGSDDFHQKDVIVFLLQLAELLKELASHSISHNDIKPTNVHVVAGGAVPPSIKLGDFDLANHRGSLDLDGIDYPPWDCLTQSRKVTTPLTDLWSLWLLVAYYLVLQADTEPRALTEDVFEDLPDKFRRGAEQRTEPWRGHLLWLSSRLARRVRERLLRESRLQDVDEVQHLPEYPSLNEIMSTLEAIANRDSAYKEWRDAFKIQVKLFKGVERAFAGNAKVAEAVFQDDSRSSRTRSGCTKELWDQIKSCMGSWDDTMVCWNGYAMGVSIPQRPRLSRSPIAGVKSSFLLPLTSRGSRESVRGSGPMFIIWLTVSTSSPS